MLKLTVTLLAVVLAGTASAGGWRSLRVDGSSEQSFAESVDALTEQLSPARRYVFVRALQDVWNEGTRAAEADQRDSSASDYLRQLDGLGYKEVVKFTDPTGATADSRWRAAYYGNRGSASPVNAASATAMQPSNQNRSPPTGWSGEQVRGIDDRSPYYQWIQR